jgi:hypothetical protein
LGNLYQSKSLVNNVFLQKKMYHIRMEDEYYVTKHLNSFNTLVSQLVFVNITLSKEYKCITLLCYFLDSWDNLVVTIGSTTQPAFLSFLSKEMRWKRMDSHSTNSLFVRVHPKERDTNKSLGGRYKS